MTQEASTITNKYIFEAQLEEYRTLRTEILQRVELQYRISYYAVALFGGILTAVVSLIGSEIIDRNQYFIILVIPWMFYIFALAYREQDFMIIKLADYLNSDLKPKIENTLEVKSDVILGWDKFLRLKTKWSLAAVIRGNSRYFFIFLPNLVFLLTFWLTVNSAWTSYEKLFFVIDILIFIDPLLVPFSIHKKYTEIFKQVCL